MYLTEKITFLQTGFENSQKEKYIKYSSRQNSEALFILNMYTYSDKNLIARSNENKTKRFSA